MFGQNLLHGVTSQKRGLVLRTVQNGGKDKFLGFFGDEFQKENLHFRTWNLGEWLNLVGGFY